MVHSAAVTWQGQAIVFPAWYHSGKSTMMCAMLDMGAGVLADDFAGVHSDGTVFSYAPTHVPLGPHHFRSMPQLTSKLGRAQKRRLRTSRLREVLGRRLPYGFVLVRPVIRRLLKRNVVDIPARTLFPDLRCPPQAPLKAVCFVASHKAPRVVARHIDIHTAVRRLIALTNFESRNFLHLLYAYDYMLPEPVQVSRHVTDWFDRQSAILESALAKAESIVELLVPLQFNVEEALSTLTETLHLEDTP
jgi:hypothetical protein